MNNKTLFICLVLILIQSLITAQTDEINKIASIIDLKMLQVRLEQAATNGEPDVITLGQGVFDLSMLEKNLRYYPLPGAPIEENFPLTIQGAGEGKTILDAGKSSKRLELYTAQLGNDMGANITVSGITFRNGGSGSNEPGLGIVTKQASIFIRNCEFLGKNGSKGSTLVVSTGGKNLGGFLDVLDCKFDGLMRTVKLYNANSNTRIKGCKFINFKDYPALEMGNTAGYCLLSECKFINNHTIRDAALNANTLQGTIKITKCRFENNTGSGGLKVAGRKGIIGIFNNTFTDNEGNKSGGALISMDGSGEINVNGNLFIGNSNNTQGGGISIITAGNKKAEVDDNKTSVGVYNNIFSGNKAAGDGGGVYLEIQKGKISVHNNTIVDNVTNYHPKCSTAAGLCLKTINNDATAWVINNIIWNNMCKNNKGTDLIIDNDPDANAVGWLLEPDGIGSTVYVSHNIVGTYNTKISKDAEVKNTLNADPMLDSDFKLKANSPAIDAGTKPGPGWKGSEDFEGKDRPIDGNGDGKKEVDIGAIEYKQK